MLSTIGRIVISLIVAVCVLVFCVDAWMGYWFWGDYDSELLDALINPRLVRYAGLLILDLAASAGLITSFLLGRLPERMLNTISRIAIGVAVAAGVWSSCDSAWMSYGFPDYYDWEAMEAFVENRPTLTALAPRVSLALGAIAGVVTFFVADRIPRSRQA